VTSGYPQLQPALKRLRDAVRGVDSEQALGDVKTMEERLGASVTQQRFSAFLLTLFAALALVLAVLGVYAVMAYSVAQRTREFGVRIALGAAAGDLVRLVFRKGFRLIAAGLALGVLGSLLASRVMSALLFGVSATDPGTFALVALIQAAVASIALYLPAVGPRASTPPRPSSSGDTLRNYACRQSWHGRVA